ncbi:MAG: hypothetical protein OEU09_12405 [Rhodospirillales bacterium]|nr:hypothetical protein [Rhodospirillales bacterium]MDH3791908.1 hypothetical protein [Rhodospirillales bacterium]MDH3912087.1 hypothetical protein [Rhodospirillales bacterium]MDH3920690.1 hypothetical protein [Rhodospirillales bacterium]MDH3970294.1 hypothetical protein [Rhodospirillales bacterium]
MADENDRRPGNNRHGLVGRRVLRDKWGEPIRPLAEQPPAKAAAPTGQGRLWHRLARRLRRSSAAAP